MIPSHIKSLIPLNIKELIHNVVSISLSRKLSGHILNLYYTPALRWVQLKENDKIVYTLMNCSTVPAEYLETSVPAWSHEELSNILPCTITQDKVVYRLLYFKNESHPNYTCMYYSNKKVLLTSSHYLQADCLFDLYRQYVEFINNGRNPAHHFNILTKLKELTNKFLMKHA